MAYGLLMKKAFYGVAGAVVLAVAAPANATVTICAGSGQQCAPQTDANVLLTSGTNLTTVQGTFNGGGQTATGEFTSTTDLLNADANGQAMISSATDSTLNQLTFELLNGVTFTTATFNLFTGGTGRFFATLTGFNSVTLADFSQSFMLSTGSNFFGVVATDGDVLTGISFSSQVGVLDFRQLRLGGVANPLISPVPEPGTWAMMLFGFGGMGVALRRRRRLTGTQLMQLA